MAEAFRHDTRAWRQAEVAWTAWLVAQGYSVLPTAEWGPNTPGTGAPMMQINGRPRRVPDVLTTHLGRTEYWEVKYRSRADLDELTGEREHWMAYDAFRDYYAVAQHAGARLWVVLYEAPTALAPGRWLRLDIGGLRDVGRRGRKFGQGGVEIDAWVWPVAGMRVIDGPTVPKDGLASPLPAEGEQERLDDDDLEFVERRSRRSQQRRSDTAAQARAAAIMTQSPELGLDVLARALELPSRPFYSVLCVNPTDDRLDDLLGLLDYGIRVFVISDALMLPASDRIRAFAASRMLEWAKVEGPLKASVYVVDGKDDAGAAAAALDAADLDGGINARQYKIVHQRPEDDVMVMAGAGTGKTETMTERFIFLLATSGLESIREGESPKPLRADEIALVTFTRDAAAEMRERIARTLMLRQRLAPKCALPALAWLMQLSGAQISTIHAFARRLVQLGGGAAGFNPGFAVSNRTREFGALLERRLSQPLVTMYGTPGRGEVPAAYEWENHIKSVWDALNNNGVDLLGFTGGDEGRVDWGQAHRGSMDADVVATTRDVIRGLAADFREDCIASQAVPTGQLVSLASASLDNLGDGSQALPRYLFVDEFQDTDRLQMRLILKVRQLVGARLFVVGDAKQGVYRFRGAAGNAFDLFRTMHDEHRVGHRVEHTLTRNFRSGRQLLDSLHPHFAAWGQRDLLAYRPEDRLQSRPDGSDESRTIQFEDVAASQAAAAAAREVAQWRRSHPNASIGILCRRNRQALEIQRELREVQHLQCDVRVGGSFFTSPAVRELRALMEAVTNPNDDAALLELCETRWAAGLLSDGSPDPALAVAWDGVAVPVQDWSSRLAVFAATSSIDREDLEVLRRRVVALRSTLEKSPTLAWVVECIRLFEPQGCEREGQPDDETERKRYARCLDQLVTRLDAQFEDSPASPERVLSWLRLQIATNTLEDEELPTVSVEGETVALTVHKSKGLEFDFVVIPYLDAKFDPPGSLTTNVAVLDGGSGDAARLAWRWRPGRGDFTNVPAQDQRLWTQESEETAREETRLLYVAMTRARAQLKVLVPPARSGSRPNSWADLIRMVAN